MLLCLPEWGSDFWREELGFLYKSLLGQIYDFIKKEKMLNSTMTFPLFFLSYYLTGWRTSSKAMVRWKKIRQWRKIWWVNSPNLLLTRVFAIWGLEAENNYLEPIWILVGMGSVSYNPEILLFPFSLWYPDCSWPYCAAPSQASHFFCASLYMYVWVWTNQKTV